ncbi:hypothetical protein BGZ73_008122 [Actinomortierella ambigua]|nr:hypothetical protein BGZ73_008122 [Actinomortierella ambigua]
MVTTYPRLSKEAAEAKAAALADKDASYSLLYFDSHGICQPIRNLFALSGVKWKQLYPQDWTNGDNADKDSTPFEVIPVLYVHGTNGETVALSESQVIETYLAKKYGFLGANEYEEQLIRAFVSNNAGFWQELISGVLKLTAATEADRAKALQSFIDNQMAKWVRIHEQHLSANGNNGHYVGDEVSLADLRAAAILSVLERLPNIHDYINEQKTPGIVALQKTLQANPKLQAWHESELFKSLRPSRQFPARPMAPGTGFSDRKGNLKFDP